MYPPDGLLTSGDTKHGVEFDPHIIAPDPFASDVCIDVIYQEDLFLLTTKFRTNRLERSTVSGRCKAEMSSAKRTEGLNTMNTGEDEPSSGLNGRLRPRKSNSRSNRNSRKSEGTNLLDKPKRTFKVSPNVTDDLVNKSDDTIPRLCPYCDKTFISKETALQHVHLIHFPTSKQNFSIDCLFCNHSEPESNNIIRHMVDSHPNQYFACLDCHTRFPSTSELAEHKVNVCEKQKLPYRSKLRQKSLEGKKNSKLSNSTESFLRDNKEFPEGFKGIVISCELKPSQVHDDADVEDNIPTNLILPSSKGIRHNAVIKKNAVIVLDDIQWNKRISSNFSFNTTDAEQILSRLGVVHRSPKNGQSTKKGWEKTVDDATQKFEKCFDTSFYTKVASNVQENLSKYLDGSFNTNPEPDSIIKTRKLKNCASINTAEGFPILLAGEQLSRTLNEGFLPQTLTPKHKCKWDSPDNDKPVNNPDQIKRDSHLNNCIVTYVSNLDIWTQMSMRRKFEEKFINLPTDKHNIIGKELKEILESREIPTISSQSVNHAERPASFVEGYDFPAALGLTPVTKAFNLQPAVLSGESVRPRCYVCCACGAQTHDSRALSTHISTQHPNAHVEHYEIVGEPLLNADILKHLYVPPSQTFNRTRPLRGIRECTKCKKSISLEDLHQHMLDCAGDTPTVRRKCRYRPFGVRKRRPRLPDNRIRKKMRKDIRSGQRNNKIHVRPIQKTKSEVGDAETIRKMLADLPAKRHRSTVNPLNSFPRKKHDRMRNKLMPKKHSVGQRQKHNVQQSATHLTSETRSISHSKDSAFDHDDEDDDDNLPLRPKTTEIKFKNNDKKESLNKKAIMNRSKRKPKKEIKLAIEKEKASEAPGDSTESSQQNLSLDSTPNRVNINNETYKAREHSSRGGSNNRDDQRPGSSRQSGNAHNSNAPAQNIPLKHSIASLTADSETHDKSVQFHRLFLIQQECNNVDQQHLPSDRRVLFENEAVITKLDKPPLHFNQRGTFDFQNHRRNKVGKPRKGLNDCIAMLKNKLSPNSVEDIPGHVSVQCGSDEPIEQEPFFIERMHDLLDPKVNSVSKSNKSVTDSDNDKISAGNTEYSENNCKEKDTLINIENDVFPTQHSDTRFENEISATELVPLMPTRNTVIRKSPKMSINPVQEEDMRVVKPTPQLCENVGNDLTNKTTDINNIGPEISSTVAEDVSELNVQLVRNSQFGSNLTDSNSLVHSTKHSNITVNNIYPSNLNSRLNLLQSENQHLPTKDTKVDQNVNHSVKTKLVYPQADYSNHSRSISPAHTIDDSCVSVPLDLSGKNVPIDRTESPSDQDRVTFIVTNNYDDYETLDLSVKNISNDQQLHDNLNIVDNISADGIVDLSIRQTPKSFSQSTPRHLWNKSSIIDENRRDLEYENIHEIIPTDLSLKKKARTSSVNLVPQMCEECDCIQDLSNHKRTRRETVQDNSIEMEYSDDEAPRNLSSKGLADNFETDVIEHASEIVTDSREFNRHSTFDKTAKTLTPEIVEPFIHNPNQEVHLQIEENESNYASNSINNELINVPNNINSSNLNDIPEVNTPIENENFVQCNSAICQQSGTVKNRPSQPFIDSICLIVPQDQMPFEIGNPTLNITITSNRDSIPQISQREEMEFETTTPLYTVENVSIPVTKTNSSGPLELTGTLPTIPGSTLSSITFDYTANEATFDAMTNYETFSVPTSTTRIDVNTNEQSLSIRDGDLSAETETFTTHDSTHTSDTLNEEYVLANEEIIDCELERDTDTARKIAMLPKEIVEILGTMPIDHRNQLLNVLPQYVSASTSVETTETINNSSISTRRLSSSRHQIISKERNVDSQPYTNPQLRPERFQRSNSDMASISACTLLSPETVPQSVILKNPIISYDNYQSTSQISQNEDFSGRLPDGNSSISALNRQIKSISQEDVKISVIDLTVDDNIQELHEEVVQVTNDDLVPFNHGYDKNQNFEQLIEPRKHKGNNEQTASLRAVRIKTPSERNKQIALEYSLEYQNMHNLVSKSVADEQIMVRYGDALSDSDTLKACNDLEINANSVQMLSQGTKSNKLLKTLEIEKARCMPNNKNANSLVNPTVILTPISIKKGINVLSVNLCEKLKNSQLKTCSISLDKNAVLENVDDKRESNLYKPPGNIKENGHFPPRKLAENDDDDGDEDSDDDISLAVIVKKKQYKQSKISSCNDNTLRILDKETTKKNEIGPVEMSTKEVRETIEEAMSRKLISTNGKFDNNIAHVRNDNIENQINDSFLKRKRMPRSRNDVPKLSKSMDLCEKLDYIHAKEQNNIFPHSSLIVKNDEEIVKTKKVEKEYTIYPVKRQNKVNENGMVDSVSDEARNHVDIKDNRSNEKEGFHGTEKDKSIEPQIDKQSKENIQTSERGAKKSVEGDYVDHNVIHDLNEMSLHKTKQILRQQPKPTTIIVSKLATKINKQARKRRQRNKKSFPIYKTQQVRSIDTEENGITPLRRSQRGKSVFLDNKSAVPNVSVEQIDLPSEQKVPLTKKQLIFSKLLLDGEKLTNPKLDSVIVKEPVVLINDVGLSPHILSSLHHNNKNAQELQQPIDNATKRGKGSKRKISPSKQKLKKQKSVDDTCDDDVSKSPFYSGNKKEKQLECAKQKISELALEETNSTQTLKSFELKNFDRGIKKNNIDSNFHKDNTIKTILTEKRKICTTSTSAEVDHDIISKKSKHTVKINPEPNQPEEFKQDKNENSKQKQNCKSKLRINNSESRNKTCYNNYVAVRRTRSKSVAVKASTPLYDPYDIDLEDMIEPDESFGRLLITANKTCSKLCFVRDPILNKSEPSTGLNTNPMLGENSVSVIDETVNSSSFKDDICDSDDSSQSDEPLQKYVDAKEKKNSKLRQCNINSENVKAQVDKHADDSKKKRGKKQTDESTNNKQQSKSDQFMESFGFFSERIPRKSNLIASKRISATFHAEETDDGDDEGKRKVKSTSNRRRRSSASKPSKSTSNLPAKRGRKKAQTSYCVICEKKFNRPDNYLRHQMTLIHISKLSEVKTKVKSTSEEEKPNFLVTFKHEIDRARILAKKKRKKRSKSTSNSTVPTFLEILEKLDKLDKLDELDNTESQHHLPHRNLSRDEALFIDCCELLKESHKPDASKNTLEQVTILTNDIEQTTAVRNNTEHPTIECNTEQLETILNNNKDGATSNYNEQATKTIDVNAVSISQAPAIETSSSNKSDEFDMGSDDDVDLLTAKNILESEEVRNLENVVVNMLVPNCSSFDLQQTESEIILSQNKTTKALSSSTIADTNSAPTQETKEAVLDPPPKRPSKPKKSLEVKDKMYPDIIENIDIFEDKFDKIKRKCRSQAAAIKQVQTVVESTLSQKGRQKTTKKRGKQTPEQINNSNIFILTKGALKGFDGLIVSIPTSEINISAIIPSTDKTLNGKKNIITTKNKDIVEMEANINHNLDNKSTINQKIDVYEFMDNEDVELFELRPSTLMGRFKNVNNRDMPSTSKFVTETEEIIFSSESGSDGDDFVYDDYVCTDDETENSLLSCELGNGKTGNDTKNRSPLKRKDIIEKNVVMGKIFKYNAVRTEKKFTDNREHFAPQANLDQLFDSLLEGEPGPSSVNTKSQIKDSEKHEPVSSKELDSFEKNESTKKNMSTFSEEPDSYKKDESFKKTESLYSKELDSYSKDECSKKHESVSSKELDSYNEDESSNKHESVSSKDIDSYIKDVSFKKHEFSERHEPANKRESTNKYESTDYLESSGKHESSKKYESFEDRKSPKKHEASDKYDTFDKSDYSFQHVSSDKPNSSSKHKSSKRHETTRKHETNNKRESSKTSDSSVQDSKKQVSLKKHDVNISENYSGKDDDAMSSDKIDVVVSKKQRSHSEQVIFDCEPSTSKDYNDESEQEIVPSSPKISDNPKSVKSSSKQGHPSTSKKSTEGQHSSKTSSHLISEPETQEISSSKKDSKLKKRRSTMSPSICDPFRRYSNYKPSEPHITEDHEDEAGVARRRSRRKCTVGKQNILAETWSSESEPESGPPRPNSAESVISEVGPKKRKKKRERQLYRSRRGVSRQMPILRQDLENKVALLKRTASTSSGGAGGIREGSSSYAAPSNSASTSAVGPPSYGPNISGAGSSGSKLRPPGPKPRSSGSKPRRRSTADSSESEEDDEHDRQQQQHGWIVGVSHKKLVTLLAHAKGRRRNHHVKRHYVE